ncbi:alpha-mannosidase [Phytoactinopolyspora halotolerans]|uniref:Alpha-mannosidase n=1 Tax=Phytoactinopolyspora halotolerans TaxID=1981512 RepID=A0A6L9SAS8_9ACTN|nr:glycoside hydrolase family 38 C-terminal domain-containing protein [Phytoactinopolyspora halotolerans]NEE02199.1 alpha-mannosidase [Phytoactinopolyspora halotolerans]
MHDNSRLVEARLDRFVRERIRPAVYRRTSPLAVQAWAVPGEPVPFEKAVTQPFEPAAIGQRWGRPWETVWFRLAGRVPDGWGGDADGARVELLLDLGFSETQPGFQAEATVYAPDGGVIKAVEPRNRYVPLADAAPGAEIDVYVEAAANPDVADGFSFRPTPLGDPETAGDETLYRLRQLDVAELDVQVWELERDVWTLAGLMRELPADLPRRAEILRALEEMMRAVDPDDVAGTAADGRAALRDVLAQPAYASAHRVVAVGHAHIDSAWLWPVRETVRKCARTFSNVLTLMDEEPGLVFAASSAQQYAWIRDHYPQLFERIRARVREGRFVPVGGMWVESDTNMPGGEAMARQFVAGKRFFAEEFGVEPQEVWLPDSFGYSAAMPQIVRAAGSRWFLTQKISWNETNTMPHHTFLWEGIDGTRLFTHFPPVDTYNSELSAAELARAQRQFAEKGRARTSLVPFGYGDGGGGPTREMLAAAARLRSLEGSPTVELAGPADFFSATEAEYADPPVWSGELYLEFHRGTYTSQARTKRGNRRSEHLLREAELWATTAAVRQGREYPYDELERLWQLVLLQQFHDILPGSSIAWVHREAERNYAQVGADVEELIDASLRALADDGDDRIMFNAGPFPAGGAPALGAGRSPRVPADGDGMGAASTTSSAIGATSATGGVEDVVASTAVSGSDFVLENAAVRVVVDERGLITSVRDLAAGREVIPSGTPANMLQLFRDTPTQWDAWDVDQLDRHAATALVDADEVDVVELDGGRRGVRVRRTFASSSVTQVITLDGDEPTVDIETTIDWHERQKLLKLAFPLDVHADRSASETQFGHVFRPTHANTSWDAAKFEICAHRWVHVGESGYGVAVANDSTYGHDVARTTRRDDDGGDGGTTTTVRLSLLRAPLFPDPDADQGEHVLRCSLRVGASIGDAVREGYRLNLPVREVRGSGAVEPLITVDNPAVVVEAVKLAEDRSGDVVVRLYESLGGRATARVTPSFDAWRAYRTDLLERPLGRSGSDEARSTRDDGSIDLEMRPFQIVTVRFARS